MRQNGARDAKTIVTDVAMTLQAWVLLAALSVLWGGSFFFVEVALSGLGPLTVVLGRVGIAAVVLVAVVGALGLRLPSAARDWRRLAGMAVLNNLLPFSLIAYGQLHVESGLASIYNATTPLFTVVLAHFFTRTEKLTPLKALGVGFGIAGVAALMGPDAVTQVDPVSLAQIAMLAAALSYAAAGIYGKRLSHLPSSVAAAGMLIAATVLLLPVAFVAETPLAYRPDWTVLAAVAGLALLSTAVAYLIYFRLLATVGATNLLLVTFLIPLSAIFLGAAFLHEKLGWNAFAGMALIFVGLAAVDGRLFGATGRRIRN
jgi:drug/metabolite transporter (DMT)-like permease